MRNTESSQTRRDTSRVSIRRVQHTPTHFIFFQKKRGEFWFWIKETIRTIASKPERASSSSSSSSSLSSSALPRAFRRPRLVPPSFSLPMRQRVAQGLVLVLFSLHSCIKPAHSIAGKCSACKAVATELQDALNKENKQRNHIDMRGRLDSKGQRYGKLIPYSVSEQRYLELVEDFCEKSRVPDYQLSAADASRNETEDSWYKAPRGTVRGAQAKTEQKEIQTYCERVMEEVEEELQTLLYEEKLNETNVEQYVCYELSPQCISKAEWKNKKKKEGMNRHTGKYDTATMKEL